MKLHGLQQTLSALTFNESAILKLLDDTANDIAQQSITNVKDDFVGSTINVEKLNGGWVVNIGSDMELAGFLEWGTGDHVVVPPETTDAYTMMWFKNGKGTLRPAPFLIPAWRVGCNKFLVELNKELKRQFG